MSKNNPIGIRSLILYDVSKWKTAEKSFTDYNKMCTALGKEPEISKDDFEIEFYQLTKEHYYAMKSGGSLPNIDIRICVLSDVLHHQQKSLQDVDKSLCEAFGTENFNYGLVDFWFHRFSAGNLNLELELYDMPIEIIHQIVDSVDVDTHFKLERVSRSMHALYQDRPRIVQRLSFEFCDCGFTLKVNNRDVADVKFRYSTQKQKLESLKEIYLQMVDFLSHPRLQLGVFQFCFYLHADHTDYFEAFFDWIKGKFDLYNGAIFPLKCYSHFVKSHILMPFLTGAHLITLRDIFNDSPIFECCNLRYEDRDDDIMDFAELEPTDDTSVFHYTCDDPALYLEFKFDFWNDHISITKMRY